METIWSKPIPKTPMPPSPQDPIEPTATKTPRKVRARRCTQAAAIFVLLATFVVFPWLVIAIYFGVDHNDPSSLISITAKIPEMLGLFDPRDEREVHHEMGEPPFVPTGVNRRHRHLTVMDNKDGLLRKERVARERQARIKAGKERQRMVREQRKRRLQKLTSLQEDEDNMIPQDSEDEPDTDTQTVKLNTFVY